MKEYLFLFCFVKPVSTFRVVFFKQIVQFISVYKSIVAQFQVVVVLTPYFRSGTTPLKPNHWIRHCQLKVLLWMMNKHLKNKEGANVGVENSEEGGTPMFCAMCLICCFALFGILAGCPHRYFCWQIVFIKSFCNKISVEVVIQLLG